MPKISAYLLVLIALAYSADAKDRDWKLGRVLDSNASTSTLTTGATSNTVATGNATAQTNGTSTTAGGTTFNNATTTATGRAQGTTTTVVHHMTIRDTELLIVGHDYEYVIEDSVVTRGPLLRKAIDNRKHGCRFIIGDDIKYIQEKAKLIVLDPDGKECSLDIVRQARVQR